MVTLGDVDSGFQAQDDLRHWPAPGGRMRDSYFWQLIMPEERLGMQIYLYLTGRGKTGYNVVVWGPDAKPLALELQQGAVGEDMDLDDFHFQGLSVKHPDPLRTTEVHYRSEQLEVVFNFEGIHDAFSFRSNPDGLPNWFAENRMEQTGHVTGHLRLEDRLVEWARPGHRDHSWGVRDWGIPHHWKWFVAYTESGRAVNGWIWIARGEWGFAGYVVEDGVTVPVSHIRHKTEYDHDMAQCSLRAEFVDITGRSTHLEMERFGVMHLPTRDRMDTVITEAACHATIDGEAGAGQFETHWQGQYLRHLIDRDT